METKSGWVALEGGRLLQPTYELNFILYPDGNITNEGINCKITLVSILQTDLKDFMTQGGLCRAIVSGIRHTAAQQEPGWSPRSNQFLRVFSIMREKGSDEDEDMEEDLEQEYARTERMDPDYVDDENMSEKSQGKMVVKKNLRSRKPMTRSSAKPHAKTENGFAKNEKWEEQQTSLGGRLA